MAISRLTALVIQTRGQDVKVRGESDGSKWRGLIELWVEDEFDRLMCSTPFVYNCKEAATEAMDEVISEIRELEVR